MGSCSVIHCFTLTLKWCINALQAALNGIFPSSLIHSWHLESQTLRVLDVHSPIVNGALFKSVYTSAAMTEAGQHFLAKPVYRLIIKA